MMLQGRPRTGGHLPISRQRLQPLCSQTSSSLTSLESPAAPPPDRRGGRRRRRPRIPANLSGTRFEVVQMAAERVGFARCQDEDFASPMLVWNDIPVPVDRITELKGHQRVNHFPGMSEISRKDSLGRNMARAARLHPEEFDFVPPTWCLPQECAQFQQFLRDSKSSGEKHVFISKPANGAMGHGIRIYKSGDQVPTSPEASSIVQLYLDKPFLVDGFKCDLRIYVLVTSCDPLRIFFYTDGLLRLSTEKYEDPHSSRSDRLCMHLTNYSINKRSGQYEKGSDDSTGSKRSIRFLNEYLQQRDHDVAHLWRSIIDLLIKTVLVAYPQVLLQYRMCRPGAPPGASSVCFEILGFDIMLDHKLKPWLLEVNRSPSFGIDEPIDRKVKLGVLEEAFSLLCIRQSDRRRCQAAQKAEAQKRLLKATLGSKGPPSSASPEPAESRDSRRQLMRRRSELEAQLQRLRRESQQEEREARTCHRFRRVFPCDDRMRQDRYVRLLLDLFAGFMDGRAPALLKELDARYDSARPGRDEIVDMLAEMDGGGGGGGISSRMGEATPSDSSAESAASGEDEEDQAEEGEEAAETAELPERRPSTGRWRRPATCRLPSVVRPASRSGSSQSIAPVNRLRAGHPHQRLKPVPQEPIISESSDEAARELHRQLVELNIRFPGKSAAEACEELSRLRQDWKFYRPKLAAYWLAKLDSGKRRQVVDIVRQNVATAVQRASSAGRADAATDARRRLTTLLSRLFGRLLASNGQGLWNTFSSSGGGGGGGGGWDAGLTQSHAELLCCQRVVRLCQDCVLTVYLYSCHEMGSAGQHHMRLI